MPSLICVQCEKELTHQVALSCIAPLKSTLIFSSGVTRISLLLCLVNTEDTSIPTGLHDGLSLPYCIDVPCFAAMTRAQLKAKNELWPCIYAPKQPTNAEKYTWGPSELQWIYESMKHVVQEAFRAQADDEVRLSL